MDGETTSLEVAKDPSSLSAEEFRRVCASALTQAPDRSYGPDDEPTPPEERLAVLGYLRARADEWQAEGGDQYAGRLGPWLFATITTLVLAFALHAAQEFVCLRAAWRAWSPCVGPACWSERTAPREGGMTREEFCARGCVDFPPRLRALGVDGQARKPRHQRSGTAKVPNV